MLHPETAIKFLYKNSSAERPTRYDGTVPSRSDRHIAQAINDWIADHHARIQQHLEGEQARLRDFYDAEADEGMDDPHVSSSSQENVAFAAEQ